MGVGLIVVIVLALVIPIVGIVAVFGIYGVRRYIANAKTAEARNTIGALASDAVTAYETGGEVLPDGTVKRRICPSASAPVPDDRNLVRARKYASAPADWQADLGANAGFACLHFEMPTPQYFQYEYEATPTSFVARAHGDLDGDGVFSTFEVRGQLVGDRLVVSPTFLEVNPDE